METLDTINNIKKSVLIFLEMESLNYEIQEDTEKRFLIYMDIGYDHGAMGYYIDFDIAHKMIQFLSFTQQSIPIKARTEVQKFYNFINQDLTLWSSIHLRSDNGVTFSKSTILVDDLEDVGLNIINRHFGINYFNLQNFYSLALKIGLDLIQAEQAFEEYKIKKNE